MGRMLLYCSFQDFNSRSLFFILIQEESMRVWELRLYKNGKREYRITKIN